MSNSTDLNLTLVARVAELTLASWGVAGHALPVIAVNSGSTLVTRFYYMSFIHT